MRSGDTSCDDRRREPVANATDELSFLAASHLVRKSAGICSSGTCTTRTRFDQESAVFNDGFEALLKQRYKCKVQFAGKDHHEGVGATEVRSDIKQRMAEADLMRAEKSQAYLLRARIYAGYRLNPKLPCPIGQC